MNYQIEGLESHLQKLLNTTKNQLSKNLNQYFTVDIEYDIEKICSLHDNHTFALKSTYHEHMAQSLQDQLPQLASKNMQKIIKTSFKDLDKQITTQFIKNTNQWASTFNYGEFAFQTNVDEQQNNLLQVQLFTGGLIELLGFYIQGPILGHVKLLVGLGINALLPPWSKDDAKRDMVQKVLKDIQQKHNVDPIITQFKDYFQQQISKNIQTLEKSQKMPENLKQLQIPEKLKYQQMQDNLKQQQMPKKQKQQQMPEGSAGLVIIKYPQLQFFQDLKQLQQDNYQKNQEVVSYDVFSSPQIVWHDPNINSQENQGYLGALGQVQYYQDCNLAYKFIKEIKKRVILITSGNKGEEIVNLVHGLNQVLFIYIFCMNPSYHKWSKDYYKIEAIEINISSLLVSMKNPFLASKLKENFLLDNVRNFMTLKQSLQKFSIKPNEDQFNQQFKLSFEQCLAFMMQSIQDNPCQFVISKQQDHQQIDSYNQMLKGDDFKGIIRMYTDQSFFFQALNMILLNGKMDQFLLSATKVASKIAFSMAQFQEECAYTGVVYRGTSLYEDQRKEYDKQVSWVILLRPFLSTSSSRQVARDFMSKGQKPYKVMFVIQIGNSNITNQIGQVRPILISQFSSFKQEEEILFAPLSYFLIEGITTKNGYDEINLKYLYTQPALTSSVYSTLI